MSQVFDELKRRNVFRVAIAYLVATWLVLQVADLVLENIGAPDWVMQALMLLFAIGFFLALIFSWAYELTPEGVKREKDVDRSQSVTRQTGRKLDLITIGMLIVVVVFVSVQRYLPAPATSTEAAASSETVTDKSIAVLAFEDLSETGDQEYFADGLSEELLNVLAQVPDLQVARRTSSFAFKGQNKDLREIGDILRVAHILEGSVRKAGSRIRVTAQLINADTGFHLFSESYDRDLDDIFAVQDELAGMIGEALQSELIGEVVTTAEVSPTEVAAYDLYLEARQKIHSRDRGLMEEAVELLDEALIIDPNYVPALTQKALAVYLLSDASGAYGDIQHDAALAVSRPLIERALEIDDRYAEAWAVSGLMMDEEGATIEEQVVVLRRALALNPSLENAKIWLSTALTALRQYDEARVLLEGIVERDPLFGPALNNVTQSYMRTREFDKATALVDRVERITGETWDVQQARGFLAFSRGELAEALGYYEPVYEANPHATVVQMFYSFTLGSLGEFHSLREVPGPMAQLYAAMAMGEHDVVEQALPQMIEMIGVGETLNFGSFYFACYDDHESLLSIVDSHFDSVDDLLSRYPRTNDLDLGYMPNVAWAYQQADRQSEFEKMVEAMAAVLELNDVKTSRFTPHLLTAMDFHAVNGNAEELMIYLRRLVEQNLTTVEPFPAIYYRQFNGNEEFSRLVATVEARADEERAKLGLAPYQSTAFPR